MSLIWGPCAQAFENFPGVISTPGQVMDQRGIAFVNAESLSNPSVGDELGITSQQRAEFRSLFSGSVGGLYTGYPERTVAPKAGEYGMYPHQEIIIGLNPASIFSDFDNDVYHALVHAGGQPGMATAPGGLGIIPSDDLSQFGQSVSELMAACKPLVPTE